MAEETVKKDKGQVGKFKKYVWVVVLILAAVIIGLLFYKQRTKIETTKEVQIEKDFTDNWQTFKSEKYGISFKYPKKESGWSITDLTDTPYERPQSSFLILHKKDDGTDTAVSVGISESRNIAIQDKNYAIQISIPFDKKNYIIFSSTTELTNEEKKVFYNIPVTLQIGNK
ncbi:MAG TPA: hypothetical protein P5096_02915 [Patescibacteria group bacterium]|nr:hypothetical protein [Patescibacteria group bacterium]